MTCVFFFAQGGFAQDLLESAWQFQFGTGSSLQRWDKELDSLASFFNGDPTLGIPGQPALRMYGKPSLNVEINYLHNLRSSITWKAGITASRQQLSYTLGNSYVDSNSIKLQTAGFQTGVYKTFHPNPSTTILIGVGANVQGLFLSNNAIYSRTDTLLSLAGLGELSSVSSLEMNRSSNIMIQGFAHLEWINKLSEHWSLSASIEARMPFTTNYAFSSSSDVTGKIDFLGQSISAPISSTQLNTRAGGLSSLQFNMGVVRVLDLKTKVKVIKAL